MSDATWASCAKAAVWTMAGVVSSWVLDALLRYLGWDDASAKLEVRYWFGIWVGLVFGRYIIWHDKLKRVARTESEEGA